VLFSGAMTYVIASLLVRLLGYVRHLGGSRDGGQTHG
jgi:hypothetical protein